VSAVILVGALVVQSLVGIVASALAVGGRRAGAGVYAVAMLRVATPVVVAAYGLRAVFGAQLKWFPLTGGGGTPVTYVLPILALAALFTGYVALLTRAEVRETLRAPFVKAARGRGLRPSRVVRVHAFRPALTSVVTFVAANVGQLFAGLMIVEGIFRMPGGGRCAVRVHPEPGPRAAGRAGDPRDGRRHHRQRDRRRPGRRPGPQGPYRRRHRLMPPVREAADYPSL
jgi:oligopeptide transport system permease protein